MEAQRNVLTKVRKETNYAYYLVAVRCADQHYPPTHVPFLNRKSPGRNVGAFSLADRSTALKKANKDARDWFLQPSARASDASVHP